MKVEEYTEDSYIVALDIAEQYNMEGLKVIIIIIIIIVKLLVRRTEEERELNLFNQNNLQAAKRQNQKARPFKIRCHGKTMT